MQSRFSRPRLALRFFRFFMFFQTLAVSDPVGLCSAGYMENPYMQMHALAHYRPPSSKLSFQATQPVRGTWYVRAEWCRWW
ncbi:hypothetical protein C8Q70DRAFT_954588 [Cubamyces menziesii]|nr:hypothetical protein C8Q70DRAFT_954588 [Cubamyces menziesii]